MTQANSADNIFKTTFIFTVIAMIAIFSKNIESKLPLAVISNTKQVAIEIIHPQIDYNRIKELISQDKLSDKEAMFYHGVK